MKKFVILQVSVLTVIMILTVLGVIDFKSALSPSAIVLSSLGAIYVATQTIQENTRINILQTTIGKIDTDYPIRNDKYASGVKKIADALGGLKKTGDELIFEDFNLAIASLDKGEHSKIKELVNYYNDIARGISRGLYDEEWVLSSLSGVHISVWMECWPFVKWHQLLDARMAKTYDIEAIDGITTMYSSYEVWILETLNPRNIYQIPDANRVNHTIELIKNTS